MSERDTRKTRKVLAVNPEAFDREYGLSDLLPAALLSDIGEAFSDPEGFPFAVLSSDGRQHYAGSQFQQNILDKLGNILSKNIIDIPQTVEVAGQNTHILPIRHEFDSIGYVALADAIGPVITKNLTMQVGILILKLLQHVISVNYQNLLTAGLHSEVVETSYDQLKEKAELLEKSEQKYRRLAEHLEMEVEKKTKVIQERQTQLMLQEKMASVGRLAAGVAHEINNPLGFIRSNLNMLKEYVSDFSRLLEGLQPLEDAIASVSTGDSFQKEIQLAGTRLKAIKNEIDVDFAFNDANQIIGESQDGVDRIAAIVSHLKVFSAVDNPGKTEVDMNSCIESTVAALGSGITERADVVRSYGELPPIVCHMDEINQALMNILLNAFQAVTDNGAIVISTRLDTESMEYVRITIEDNGIGIASEDLGHVFEPFFTTRPIGEGVGLGLSIAQNIIHRHNGHIRLESRPGHGTVVKILLPLTSI